MSVKAGTNGTAEKRRESFRMRRAAPMGAKGLCFVVWATLVAAGFGYAWRYEATPGAAAKPMDWPQGAGFLLDATRPTVVQFVHPECPCSRVGLHQVADVMRSRPDRLLLVVVVVGTSGPKDDPGASSNARLAASISGSRVVFDASGREAARFGAQTSGQTFAFSPFGESIFRGGVTIARGHYGENRGLDVLTAIAEGRPVPKASTPVFGCALRGGSMTPALTTPLGEANFRRHRNEVFVRTDRMFAWVMGVQYVLAVAFALATNARTWSGGSSAMHPHVWIAVLLGGALAFGPILLARRAPGETSTRMLVAVSQGLFSALLIHLTDGRIETHFHLFGSLALLAMYRDWRVLAVNSGVVVLDHAVRGALFPLTFYGVGHGAEWRFVEHAGWILFETRFSLWRQPTRFAR